MRQQLIKSSLIKYPITLFLIKLRRNKSNIYWKYNCTLRYRYDVVLAIFGWFVMESTEKCASMFFLSNFWPRMFINSSIRKQTLNDLIIKSVIVQQNETFSNGLFTPLWVLPLILTLFANNMRVLKVQKPRPTWKLGSQTTRKCWWKMKNCQKLFLKLFAKYFTKKILNF